MVEHNSLSSVVSLQRYTMAMKVGDHSRFRHDDHITADLFLLCVESVSAEDLEHRSIDPDGIEKSWHSTSRGVMDRTRPWELERSAVLPSARRDRHPLQLLKRGSMTVA